MIVESQLKIRKSSWGIYIRIEAKVEVAEALSVEVPNDLPIILDEEELSLLRKGIESLWKENSEHPSFEIRMTQIHFNLCDYQKEGLYWVGRNLAEKILELPPSEPNYVFDKVQNKYVFSDLIIDED